MGAVLQGDLASEHTRAKPGSAEGHWAQWFGWCSWVLHHQTFKWLLIGLQARNTRATLTLTHGRRWPHQDCRSRRLNLVPWWVCPSTQI